MSRQNEAEIPLVKQLAPQVGADALTFKTLNPDNEDFYTPLSSEFTGGKALIPGEPRYRRFRAGPRGEPRVYRRRNPCKHLWNAPVIHWDGTVVSCSFDPGELYPLGNLRDGSFWEIWKGEAYRKMRRQFRDNWPQMPRCGDCSYAWEGGSCSHETIAESIFYRTGRTGAVRGDRNDAGESVRVPGALHRHRLLQRPLEHRHVPGFSAPAEDSRTFETILVDSSTDGTGDLVRQRYPEVQLITSSSRLFCGDARNGRPRRPGRIIAFLDADCFVEPGWVDAVLEAHRTPHLLVSGVVLNGTPDRQVAWAYYFCEFSHWLPGGAIREIPEAAGCCLSFKREAYEAYGPFLEGTYSSDTAFQRRAWRDGHQVYLDPSIRIFHRT